MVSTVPVADLAAGANVFSADSPFSYDRWANPANVTIFDNGVWRTLSPGETVPAGATFSIYTDTAGQVSGQPPPAIGGGQETVTGQDRVWQDHQIAMDLANAANQVRQLDQLDEQMRVQHEQFMASLNMQAQIANQNFQVQAAQVGVQAAQVDLQAQIANINAEAQAADLNFRQRQSEIQEARADAQLNLQAAATRVQEERLAERLNFDQRAELASLQQNAMQMLADRSGPQDWTKYNALLNNLAGPDAAATGEVNPFALLDDFYQPYTPDTTGLEGDFQSDLGGLVQPHTPGTATSTAGGALAGLGGAGTVTAPGAAGPQPTSAPLGEGGGIADEPVPGTEIPHSDPVANEVPLDPSPGIMDDTLDPGWNLVGVGEGSGIAGTRFNPDFQWWGQGDDGYYQLGPEDTATAGGAYWINTTPGETEPDQYPWMNRGGLLKGYAGGGRAQGVAITGDRPDGKRTGYEEAVIPLGGDALILDRHKTKSLLNGGAPRMARGGMVRPQMVQNMGAPQRGQGRMPQRRPNLLQRMPMRRMAGGGIVSDTVGGADPDSFTYNVYDDQDLYNMPFLRKIRGEEPGRQFGAFGGGDTVGPWGLPSNLSISRYRDLLPTEQQMLQGAYDDPRTGLAFDDVMAGAQRASIGTRGFGGAAAYGR